MYQMEVSGIIFEVHNKPVRRLRVVLCPARSRISAPMHMKPEAIRVFIISKMDWIKKHRERFAKLEPVRTQEYTDGEAHYLFGRKYLLKVEETIGRPAVVACEDGVLELRVKAGTPQKRIKALMDDWYKKELAAKIPELLAKWELRTGCRISAWQIRAMKTRWGTCNYREARIKLNLELARRPIECLDYVILHEVLHMKVHNHGREFKALLDRHMPGWKAFKKQLRYI